MTGISSAGLFRRSGALSSNWTEVMGFIKPFEGIVNKLLALLIVGVVVWFGLAGMEARPRLPLKPFRRGA